MTSSVRWNLLKLRDFRLLPEVGEIWAFLGYYAECSGYSSPTFRENLSVPSSRPRNPLKMEPVGCRETSIMNCHYTLRNSTVQHRC